jgi:hypothetical protein
MPTPQEFQLSCGVGVGACGAFSLFIFTYLTQVASYTTLVLY